jgi:hypothetical protein
LIDEVPVLWPDLTRRFAKDNLGPQIPDPDFEVLHGKELSICPLGEKFRDNSLSFSKANWGADGLEGERRFSVRQQSGLSVKLTTDEEDIDQVSCLADRPYLDTGEQIVVDSVPKLPRNTKERRRFVVLTNAADC